MNFETMAAGREMDALIDEKVMGHPQCKQNHAQSQGWCMSCNPPIWEDLPGGYKHGRPTQNVRANGFWPSYSTDIDAAWEVVEKVTKEHPGIGIGGSFANRLVLSMPNHEPLRFGVRFSCRGHITEAWGETAPLAICRAALKAALGTPEVREEESD